MTYADPRARPAFVGRVVDIGQAVADWAVRVRVLSPRPIRWLLSDPRRMLTLAWFVGLIIAGTARSATAESIIVGPDLAHGGQKTLFESYDFLTYSLTVKPDDNNTGWFDLEKGVLEVIGFVNNLIMWLCLGLLYGALTLLEWFLNLTIYRDSADQIDTATQMIANNVFWPLIAATVAIGAFMAYARWRGEGRGFLTDLGWVVAAAAIAVGFAAGPSKIMNEVDSVRQDMAAGIISGSAQYAAVAGNPTGFPTPQIGGNPQEAGTRKLVDSVWSTFGASPWCFAEFYDTATCKAAGYHALANDDTWQKWMKTLDDQATVPEFHEHEDWIRGQDMRRAGVLLMLAMISIPMALMLLRLVIAGLVAVVGLLLMLVIGLLFLAFWPIPGWFRQTGTRYWIYTLGLELQGLFITVVISGTTVVSVIITTQAGRYGYFLVAVLNLVLFFAAIKARSWLEMLTTMGGAGSLGLGTALIMRSVARTVVAAGAGIASGGTSAVLTAGKMLSKGGRGPGWGSQPGATSSSIGTRRGSTPRGGSGKLSALGGALRATATRQPTPGSNPALPGQPPRGLPAGTGAGPAASSGRGPSSMASQGGRRPHSAGSSASGIDSKVMKNVHRSQTKTGTTGRVWVDKPGSGLSSLEKTPRPKPSRVYNISTLPRRRKGGTT